MSYTEKPSKRRTRVVIAGLLWLLLVPFFVGMWLLLGWFVTLLFVVASVWLTQDYIRRGSFANADTVTRAGGWSGEHRSER
jgi:hypothetical protein